MINKKYLILTFTFLLFISGCAANTKKTQTIRLNEVVHSIFYAPQYVAMEKGFFQAEGLDIDLSVGQGADKSMAALLSNSADISLLGIEAGIYVYNEGKEDYPVAFAQLTQRAGNFLVSRENIPNFQWSDVKGKSIIGGRPGGMPQMILEYVLKKNNLDPAQDVDMINNIQFTSTSGAFVGGEGDFTAEFDPSAYNIEKEGKGYVVASLGLESGKIPYTVYMASQGFMQKNPQAMQGFTNAIYQGQQWVNTHSAKEIAEVVAPYFKENDLASLEFMIDRYKSQETWKDTPSIDPQGFELIQDIMEQGGQLAKRVSFEKFVNITFAAEAVK